MNVTLNYFGKLTDYTKCSQEVLSLSNEQTLEMVMHELYQKYPGLEDTVHTLFINNKKADKEHFELRNNDSIILMPPFSGG